MDKQIESCIEKLEQCADPATRETARQLVQALLAFHATALGRIVALGSKNGGSAFVESLAADMEARPALLLHGLHPVDLETRVASALEKVRPHLQSHGGNVELLGIDEGRVRLRLIGNCHGCPSSSLTMKTAIEEALLESAPDLAAIEVL